MKLGSCIHLEELRNESLPMPVGDLEIVKKNDPAHILECLCLKWAVTDKFHDYLYGNTFTVCTDNNPLTYVLSSAKLDATGHRWPLP